VSSEVSGRGLGHDSAPGGDHGSELHSEEGFGGVPRGDRGDDAERLPADNSAVLAAGRELLLNDLGAFFAALLYAASAIRISCSTHQRGAPFCRATRFVISGARLPNSSATRPRISLRSAGLVRLQLPNAVRAALTAWSTSAALATGTVPTISSVAGFTAVNRSVADARTNEPAINRSS
jgi:hypothetical protein